MSVVINECTHEDISILQQISRDTFYETFAHMNSEDNMKDYLENSLSIEKLEEEISNPSSKFYFIFCNRVLAGYLKVNINGAQTEDMGEETLEIERIYIRHEFQNNGLGRQLLSKGLDVAGLQNKTKIWLGVWEHNEGALSFYNKMGFVHISSHSFYMSDEQQTDFIMMKIID